MTRGMLTAALSAAMIAIGSGCATPQADNVRETYLDAEFRGLHVIDVALLKPEVAGNSGVVVSRAMRDAAREYLMDQKAYSVLSETATDSAASAGGVDATSGGPAVARAIESTDAVCLIHVTEWDRDWLVPRSTIYASGRVAIYSRRDGRRLYESTFTRERLAVAGKLSDRNNTEAETQMAKDLMRTTLAGLPRKVTQ